MEMQHWATPIIAGLILAVFCFTVFYCVLRRPKDDKEHDLALRLIATLQSVVLVAVGFYFGNVGSNQIASSAVEKSELLQSKSQVQDSKTIAIEEGVSDVRAKFNNLKTTIEKLPDIDPATKAALVQTLGGVDDEIKDVENKSDRAVDDITSTPES